jgi:hypothetical protein
MANRCRRTLERVASIAVSWWKQRLFGPPAGSVLDRPGGHVDIRYPAKVRALPPLVGDAGTLEIECELTGKHHAGGWERFGGESLFPRRYWMPAGDDYSCELRFRVTGHALVLLTTPQPEGVSFASAWNIYSRDAAQTAYETVRIEHLWNAGRTRVVLRGFVANFPPTWYVIDLAPVVRWGMWARGTPPVPPETAEEVLARDHVSHWHIATS